MHLLEWRSAKNLNQTEAAGVLGLAQGTISRIETGEIFPSGEMLTQLSERSDGLITAGDLHARYVALKRDGAAA